MKPIHALVAGLCLSAAAAAPALADPCYTVGLGGTHPRVQLAVNAALAPGGLDCIRVAAGSRAERLEIPDGLAGRTLTISGGWTEVFTRQTGSTTLDGAGQAPVVQLFLRSGNLVLGRLRITNGNRSTLGPEYGGGGLRVILRDTAWVRLEDSEVVNNRLVGLGGNGGGLKADLNGSAILRVERTTFAGNAMQAATGQAHGGGAEITALGEARVAVLDSDFLNNEVSGPDYTDAGALHVFVGDNAFAEVSDNVFRANRTLSLAGHAWGSVILASGGTGDAAELEARRNDIQHNLVQQVGGHQLELRAGTGSTLRVSDSVVANGAVTGILAWPDGGTMYLTNLTVTRQAGHGLRVIGGEDTVFLSNSILFGNGTDLAGEPVQQKNLVGTDPSFLDPSSGDFHLGPGSVAIDNGAFSTTGGLGPLDLDRETRLQGGLVDQGAYETSAGAGAGAGLACSIRGLTIPAPHFSTVCRCLADDSLREFHCAFFLPEVLVDMRFPFVSPEGQPLPVEWSIRPWTSVGSGAYSMRAEAQLGGQWVQQQWLGPKAPGLKRGQVVTELFRVSVPPGGPTPLRTLINYPLRSGQARGQFWMQVFLPDVSPVPTP